MQQTINFTNRKDIGLSGALHLPDTKEVQAYALYAHCFTCTKSIKAAITIANTLAQHGIATMRFDFTGLGGSKGAFADSNFSTDINDVIDAANYLASEHQAPQLLVGHSLGGTAILAAAEHIESAKAVVSIGSPADPSHILHLLEEHLTVLEQEGEADITLAGRPFKFKQEFVDDLKHHEIDYRGLGKALMVMHSPTDETVSVDEASKIFLRAMHPKSFISLDNADHLLSRTADAQYAADVLSSWAMRYLEPQTNEKAPVHGVLVSANTEQGFLCKIDASGHQLVADEPIRVGGTNLGPSPYDYLAVALGSCTAMTLNMYARHKKFDLDKVSVDVTHSRAHAEDCVDCEKSDGQVDLLKRDIFLEGNLTDQQRKRMLEIADRCPVHKTLENEIKIISELEAKNTQ